mgnify:CR=1 FL=1
MSRGFVKEGDQEEPIKIPPRAALPDAEVNYVTPKGKELLIEEKKSLEHQKKSLNLEDETEKRRELSFIDGKLGLLIQRLNTAHVINPKEQPPGEVRFGAHVDFKLNGVRQSFKIVGVDEANVKDHKIAFTSPIAKALTSKRVGDSFDFKLGDEVRPIEILKISY